MSTLETIVPAVPAAVPRLGFLGVGWIGLSRMRALRRSGAGLVAAVADAAQERVDEACSDVPSARPAATLEELLALELDGIVIATPSALHADQAVRALEHGLAVFCQKPLARTAPETRRVIAAARAANRLLGVDLSYRYTTALRRVRAMVRSGALGPVHSVDLVFHNAYGPSRDWARHPALAGGGCVIDLGIHLTDMLLWVLDFPTVVDVTSELYARGQRIRPGTAEVCEDFATATIELAGGTSARIACSWDASIGRDALIAAVFHGASGTVAMRNVDGSFFDFVAEEYHGAAAVTLSAPPDDWGGRALIAWAQRLAHDASFDPAVDTMIDVAATLDRMLGR